VHGSGLIAPPSSCSCSVMRSRFEAVQAQHGGDEGDAATDPCHLSFFELAARLSRKDAAKLFYQTLQAWHRCCRTSQLLGICAVCKRLGTACNRQPLCRRLPQPPPPAAFITSLYSGRSCPAGPLPRIPQHPPGGALWRHHTHPRPAPVRLGWAACAAGAPTTRRVSQCAAKMG
jgi:hypothetical protein